MKTGCALLAVAGAAMAQRFAGQPACATGCLSSAIAAAGCGSDDLGCQCGEKNSEIANKAVPCLISSCPAAQLMQIRSAASAVCSGYSATAAPAAVLARITEPASLPSPYPDIPAKIVIITRPIVVTVSATEPTLAPTMSTSEDMPTASAAVVGAPVFFAAGVILGLLAITAFL
ncbi:hypothetical protein N656DRAFT_59052 [Canariomyces notabilis]|uniref:CFEM domain-containing protein n=1 Tax=Canariomyces notabilis TaxID=2074819 RepID=A0AAN6TPG6_9PEZI|nr:hypothetical protein N656DRAFT_59052 [Canariomyces arenarius]